MRQPVRTRKWPPGELGQPVEVVAGAPLLATGEMALADGAGKARVALRVAGEDDQVGPGRVGDPGARGRRHGPSRRRSQGCEAARVSSAPKTVGTPSLLCRLGEADHAVEPVVVGQSQGAELEPGGLGDELLGVRGTVEKAEIRMAVKLRVPDHRNRIVIYRTYVRERWLSRPRRLCPVFHTGHLSKLPASSATMTRWQERVGPRVLVVDDEESITELVSMALRYEGFEVQTASSGYGALEQIDAFRPDLILLDVMLPDIDGFNIAERLRRDRRDIPVLFLTARDATEDKIRGLTIGGDDYVTKPFSVAELVARTQAILRRAGKGGPARELLQLADLEMDDDAHEVRRAGQLIDLTATEYRLLRYLLSNPRRVLTRSQLLDHVWNYDFGGDAGVLETYVSYLRKKVDFTEPHLIHTVRGVGYVLRPPRN